MLLTADSSPTPPRPPALDGRRRVSRQWFGGVVRVLERDPDLTQELEPEAAAAARAQAVAPTLVLDTGTWTPPAADRCSRVLGLLILDGLMTRCLSVNGVLCPELLGQGDVIRPWDDPVGASHRAGQASWRVLQPATVAVLDARFVETVRRWPWITSALMSRAIQRSRWLALQTALPQVRRADDRLRLLFSDLAVRWGRVTPHGVVLPLPLTNQLLGELACLRRPTVSSTMTRLAEAGEIVRREGAGFLLNLADTPSHAESADVAA